MKSLEHLKITVREPFSGGSLAIKEGDTRVLPLIYLAPVEEPSYAGVTKALADYDRAHSKKGGYILLFTREELPFITFKQALSWEVEGQPKENVEVDIEALDLGLEAAAVGSGLYMFLKKK